MKNEIDYRKHLKQFGKKPHVIEGLVNEAKNFEAWLLREKSKTIENASAEDLESFANQLPQKELKIYMRALALFYRWLGNEELKELARSMRAKETAKTRRVFNLREFKGVNLNHVAKLEAMGVKNVEDMLTAARTSQLRKELEEISGVPYESILELVKLSDLSRLRGVKGIRARLYYDAGIDTVEAFSHWESEAMQIYLEKFVQESGFEGIAPLPKEINGTIKQAANLEKLLEL